MVDPADMLRGRPDAAAGASQSLARDFEHDHVAQAILITTSKCKQSVTAQDLEDVHQCMGQSIEEHRRHCCTEQDSPMNNYLACINTTV